MPFKKLLFIILLFFTPINAFADVFVVTSNSDSGPGTLRDALTQAAANGTATQDIINFNIADQSEAGRTITLLTNLPDVSPDLVIDGGTQPGTTFGVSDSKVKIVNIYTSQTISPTGIHIFAGNNIGNLSVSGLWLIATYIYASNVPMFDINGAGIVNITHCLVQCGKIQLAGCQSVIFKSNMVGYLPDGITAYPTSLIINDTPNFTIGGSVNEGNLFSGDVQAINYHYVAQTTYLISNNKFGTDYTGKISSPNLFTMNGRITVRTNYYNLTITSPGNASGDILNNLVVNFGSVGIFTEGTGTVNIKGNCINTDITGTINYQLFEPSYIQLGSSIAPTGIVLQTGISAIIGGSNPGDANILGHLSNGILEQLSKQSVITQNSIFCISKNFNIHDFVTTAYTTPWPTVQINSISNNTVSGLATAGSRVELFGNNEGECPSCDPRHFFTFVTADAQGNWTYTGALPANIIASAIYNNQTSHFTEAQINLQNLQVTQPNCGDSSGAISGITVLNTNDIKWIDQNNNIISTSLNISNLPREIAFNFLTCD